MSTSATQTRKNLSKTSAARRVKPPARGKRNRAGRPTAKELERRKARVMSVATEMFIDRGYAATTLLDIAKKAGVATRTLYQHFGDKEAIFREVIFARDIAVVAPPSLKEGESLVSALRKAARFSYEVALRPQSIDLMRLMIAESARFPELMNEVTNKIFSRFKGQVAALFRQLAEKGLIPDGKHDESADLFVDLLLGNRTTMIYFGWMSTPPTRKDTETKIDLFIKGRFGAEHAAGPAVMKRATKRAAANDKPAKAPAAKRVASKKPPVKKPAAKKRPAGKPA